MNKPINKKQVQPEILYEEARVGEYNMFPFVETTKENDMPISLWIFEYNHTGEFEPGSKGEEVPIVDQIPHQFVNLTVLKDRLDPKLYDSIRIALGMLPLKEASQKGKEKLDKIMSNINIEKIKNDIVSKRNNEEKKENK